MPPNAWTLHVKQFAKEHNLSYGCAMSTPECRQSYHRPARERRPARESSFRKQHASRPKRRRLSDEEEFYRRNPQLNIERMAGEYDYGEY
jgi:hypothetical protein